MSEEYYLIHGLRLDSEHETMDSALARAASIMAEYGLNHALLKIGKRDDQVDNDILLIYCKLAKYAREETTS